MISAAGRIEVGHESGAIRRKPHVQGPLAAVLGQTIQVSVRAADWLERGEGSFHDTVVPRPLVCVWGRPTTKPGSSSTMPSCVGMELVGAGYEPPLDVAAALSEAEVRAAGR